MKNILKSPLGSILAKQSQQTALEELTKNLFNILESFKTATKDITTLEDAQEVIRDLSIVLEALANGELEHGLRLRGQEQQTGTTEPTTEAIEEPSGQGIEEHSLEPTTDSDKSLDGQGIIVFKEASGKYRWLGIVSNNYTDRHAELLSKEAHLDFVNAVQSKQYPYPELWFQHQNQLKLGEVDYVNFDEQSGMLVASGVFHEEWNTLAENLAKSKLAWGMSHGMPTNEIVKEKGVYKRYRSREFSLLRLDRAANVLTSFAAGDTMAQRKEIKEDLEKLLEGDAVRLEAYTATLDKQAEIAQELNLTQKEVNVEKEDILKEIMDVLVPVLDEVKALRQEVTELKTGVVKSDAPAVTLSTLVQQYLQSGVTKEENKQPDPSQFRTPQVAKQAGESDLFSQLNSGIFNVAKQ